MNRTITITKVSQKGTIHIPKEILTELKISERDKIVWKLVDSQIVIEKLS